MQAAAQVLGRLDVRKRQLSSSQRRALGRAGCLSAVYLVVLAVCAVPFLGVGGYGVYVALSQDDDPRIIALMVVVSLAPALVFALFAAVGLGWMRRTRRRLEVACAAILPQQAGDPALCHLCGAPLHPSGSDPIARCSYCAADNLVAPDVLARTARRQTQVMDGFDWEVQRRGTAVSSVGVKVIVGLPLAAVASPIIAVVSLFIILLVLVQLEGPVDTSIRYVLADTSSGRCVAQYRPSAPEAEQVYLGKWAEGEAATDRDS